MSNSAATRGEQRSDTAHSTLPIGARPCMLYQHALLNPHHQESPQTPTPHIPPTPTNTSPPPLTRYIAPLLAALAEGPGAHQGQPQLREPLAGVSNVVAAQRIQLPGDGWGAAAWEMQAGQCQGGNRGAVYTA